QTQAPGWPVAGWPVPPTSRALVARPTDALALTAGHDVWFRHVSVEYRATRTVNERPATTSGGGISWFRDALVPSARTLILGGLPDGDWVVRVTAHFDSFETEPAGELGAGTYFPIPSRQGPF